MRSSSLRPFVTALVLGVLVPAGVATAAAAPKVTAIKPLELRIGQKLTITGRGFLPGKNRTTVVFKRDGERAVFTKAQSATATRLVVEVPAKLAPFLATKDSEPRPTRFRIRVLARRFAADYTVSARSPVIGPAAGAPGGPPAGPDADADCDKDTIRNDVDPDDDNDQLDDVLEATLKTNACLADSDADGVSDAFEYESARDLNVRALPYPGKRPYSNALDAADANVDFDQDGLTQSEEYQLWLASVGGQLPLSYSDGDQDTNRDPNAQRTPAASVPNALDRDNDGYLTDDEKDGDADYLTNFEETHGQLTTGWWPAAYANEKHFAGRPGAAVLFAPSFLDPDSDGDGVLDGLDDQDHDGFANGDELRRVSGQPMVHVYNPCLPDPDSRTCTLHPPFSEPWAPFPGPLPAPGNLVIWP